MGNSKSILFLLSILLTPAFLLAQLAAFPGAAGFGATTIGGRGGALIEVTNLNDDGPGSFRQACSTPGPRTIVFRTGGIIELKSAIQLTEPFVTIAGQTAPGDGIVLKNFSFSIFTHDIIIRGMRFRPGDDADGERADHRDCVSMQFGTYNVIMDHCSMSWGLDENLSLDSVNNITIQWCVISEALYRNRHPKGPHSMGFLVAFGSEFVSLHHNLFAHNYGRNPLIMGGTDHEVINNVIYDWGYNSEFQENGKLLEVDIIGNYWKPLTTTIGKQEFPIAIDFDGSTTFGSKIFGPNNISPNGLFFTSNQISSFGANSVIFSDSSMMSMKTGIPTFTAAIAYDTVLAYTGAIHPIRDVIDTRVIKDVRDSTGGIKDCINPGPMLLDSGNVIQATDTSLVYDQMNQNPAISPEGRKIEIVSGKGAGQIRYGTGVKTLDAVKRIIEAFVDVPWTTNPDSTSTYKVIATCDNVVGGWPLYSTASPYIDTDQDGMPDSWETNHGLNPNDPADRNGTTVNTLGYTNLEVYLNEYYTPGITTSFDELPAQEGQFKMRVYPNPFSESVTISFAITEDAEFALNVYDMYGRFVKNIRNGFCNQGEYRVNWNGTDQEGNKLSSGVYFIELKNPKFPIFFRKILLR